MVGWRRSTSILQHTHRPSHWSTVSGVAPCPQHRHTGLQSQHCTGCVHEGEQEKISLLADGGSSYSLCHGWPAWSLITTRSSRFKSSPEHLGLSWSAAWWLWWRRLRWVSNIWEDEGKENVSSKKTVVEISFSYGLQKTLKCLQRVGENLSRTA